MVTAVGTCTLRASQAGNANYLAAPDVDRTFQITAPVVTTNTVPPRLVSIGGGHTCALTSNGGVRCWGRNDFGQLGDGSTTYRYVPVAISGASSVIALAAGINHTCAAQGGGIGGTVVCWGGNTLGQLGDGTNNNCYNIIS